MADQTDEDEFAKRSVRFMEWLVENGCNISPRIELTDLRYRSAGRGLVATKDIEEDEEIFSIPRSSILTFETSTFQQATPGQLNDHWMMLIMAMVHEYRQSSKSSWQPYFDVLPEDFDTLMYWSDDELRLLEGSAVLNKIGKAGADEAFKKHLPLVRANAVELEGQELDDTKALQLCHRMGSTIMAYAFDLEKQSAQNGAEADGWEEDAEEDDNLPKGMIPLADLLNADADRNNAKLFYEEDNVVMKTIKSVKKGEELFNDYGPLPRADVLRRYGYITDNYAKYDVVEISLDFIKEAVKELFPLYREEIDTRIQYLDGQGALEDGYDIYRASNEDGQFSDELKILLSALIILKPDFDKLEKKGKLPKPELDRYSAYLLSEILIRRRAMYPPLEQRIKNGNVGSSDKPDDRSSQNRTERRRAMALQVIAGEKQVLQEAADIVERLLGDLRAEFMGKEEPADKKRKADEFESDARIIQERNKKKNQR